MNINLKHPKSNKFNSKDSTGGCVMPCYKGPSDIRQVNQGPWKMVIY